MPAVFPSKRIDTSVRPSAIQGWIGLAEVERMNTIYAAGSDVLNRTITKQISSPNVILFEGS
jgi:hypothetical protein